MRQFAIVYLALVSALLWVAQPSAAEQPAAVAVCDKCQDLAVLTNKTLDRHREVTRLEGEARAKLQARLLSLESTVKEQLKRVVELTVEKTTSLQEWARLSAKLEPCDLGCNDKTSTPSLQPAGRLPSTTGTGGGTKSDPAPPHAPATPSGAAQDVSVAVCKNCERDEKILKDWQERKRLELERVDNLQIQLAILTSERGKPGADLDAIAAKANKLSHELGSPEDREKKLADHDKNIDFLSKTLAACQKGCRKPWWTRSLFYIPVAAAGVIGGVAAGGSDGTSTAGTATTNAGFILNVGTGELHEGPSQACVSLTPVPRQPGAAWRVEAMGSSVRPGQNLSGVLDASGAAVVRIAISQTGPITVVATVTSGGVQQTVTTTFEVTGTPKPCSAGQ